MFVLSFIVVTLLFGRTREMATSAVSVVYIGSIISSLKASYANPYNWGVPDFTDKYDTWDEAYAAAKKQKN